MTTKTLSHEPQNPRPNRPTRAPSKEELQTLPNRAAEVLARVGFIGCGEADPNLSENYKQYRRERDRLPQ